VASGKTHDLINLIALPPIVYYLSPSDFWSFLAGYMAGTFLLSPDLDLYHSRPAKRWKILRFIWKPYTKFSKHRGISHIPFYGSIIKLIYLSVLFLAFYYLIWYGLNYFDIDIINIPDVRHIPIKDILFNVHTISFLSGLFIAEMIHIFVDIIYSSLKKLKVIR